MASATLVKKAFTLPPTVRTLASGVPAAHLLNLQARPGSTLLPILAFLEAWLV